MSNSRQQDVETVVREAEALLSDSDIFQSEEIFFPTKEKATRLRIKSARAVLPALKRTLNPGEKVRFISARGFIYYPWEQFFGAGAWTMYLNGMTAVLTDRRLLVFNVTHRSREPKDIKNAVPLAEITSARRLRALLTLRLRDGRKLRISGLYPADAKELHARLERELEGQPGRPAAVGAGTRSVQPLCPICCRPIENIDSLWCVSCRTEFRSGKTAALRSLLLPGLGDIYLKHRAVGAIELVGSVIVWLIAISLLLSGEPVLAVVLLATVNGVDYFVTKAMAKKGIIAK